MVFSLQSGIGLEGAFGGAHFQADELPSLTSKADITGIFYQSGDGSIGGRVEFDNSVFKTENIAGFLEVFKTLVHSAAHAPQARFDELVYQSDADLARFLEFSCGSPLDTADSSIPERFAEMVRTHPEHIALVFGERRSTYRQLDEWSNRIASGLARHVTLGSRVGLSMQKSDALVASVLAILKLGCAYVPLDPTYPPDRLRFFAENAGVHSVVADVFSRDALSKVGLDGLDFVNPVDCENEAVIDLPAVSPEAMAYIIHTSGSTGQPKGVMIEHRTVVRLIDATSTQVFAFEPDSVGSLVASLNFDASVIELFSALLNGLTLVVISEEDRKSPPLLHKALLDQQVSHVTVLSPVILQNLPRLPLPSLKMIGYGGDTIDEQTADWWSRQTRLFTVYGPTETTVLASCGEILPGANSRVIGKPLAGYRLYLLNP